MSGDGAKIVPQDAANALGRWDSAASTLQTNYSAKAGDAVNAIGDGSWIGSGDAADAFRKNFDVTTIKNFLAPHASFDSEPGAKQSNTGGAIVGGVANLGTSARTAIEQSLGSDEQQGAVMKTAHRTASNGAHDSGPAGSTSTGSTGTSSSRSTSVSTGTGSGSTGSGSTGSGSTGSGSTEQQGQAIQDAVLLQSGTGTTGTGTNLPITPRVGQDGASTTPGYLLPNQPLQPIDRPVPGSNQVTSHEASRDNLLPNQPLQPIDQPLPGSNQVASHVTSHEATRDNLLPNQPLQPIDQPLPGSNQVASHEATRGNVLPGHHGDHPVGHVTSHESTRDNVLPGHDGGDNQPPTHAARRAPIVNDPQPIIDREVVPETEPPGAR